MHKVAEYGVAAHWLYKEKAKFLPQINKNDELWNVEQAKASYNDQQRLKKNSIFFEAEVFCITPKGEVLHFPQGATPIDFAYRVHKEIGHRIMNVKVNNKIASFNYKLKNGDIVEIMTFKAEKGPHREWLRQDKDYVKSKATRVKILQWFRQHTSS
jgi:GTP pyrophosphokinase